MEEEFVPYPLALILKALGFNEPCLCSWNFYTNELNYNGQPSTFSSEDVIQLPTFSQAFRWFREKHRQPHIWMMDDLLDTGNYSYEEAEIFCLEKLLKIVESKSE